MSDAGPESAEALPHAIEVPVGVVVVRETIDHPWQSHRWRPAQLLLDAPGDAVWLELSREPGSVRYLAGTLALELHRKETAGYRRNLAESHPYVFVVLRHDPAAADEHPVLHLVTASPDEVQAYGGSGVEIIEQVPMPEPLVALLHRFVDAQHADEPFIKRQRNRHHASDEHKFGQEPLHTLRARRGSEGTGDA
jgi:Protein of unknown function (DUF3305)